MSLEKLVTSFTVESTVNRQNAPFTIGQSFAPGDVPMGKDIVTDSSDVKFQAVIQNRWPDGSAKFAIVSGLVGNLSAGVAKKIDVYSGSQSAGVPLEESYLKSLSPAVHVSFTAGSGDKLDVSLAPLIGVESKYDSSLGMHLPGRVYEFIKGPIMSSFVYSSAFGSDASLRAWFEVRVFRSGEVEIFPWSENGYLLKNGAAEKNGTFEVLVDGRTVFSESILLPHHGATPLLKGKTQSYFRSGVGSLIIKHDVAYIQKSRAVPTYYTESGMNATLVGNLVQDYTPLGVHNLSPSMGTAGYHPSIGLISEWDVSYLFTKADPKSFNAIVVNAMANGRYPIYYRDEKTNLPLKFSAFPNLCFNSANTNGGGGLSSVGQITSTGTGAAPQKFGTSHHHSIGFMAYLLTGRYFFMEVTQHAAVGFYLRQGDVGRKFSKGIIEGSAGANTTRGAAWVLRTLAQAIYVTPDSHPLKSEFRKSLDENILYYHKMYVEGSNNPYGFTKPYSDYTPSGDNKWLSAIWMDDFQTGVFGYIYDLQLYDPGINIKMKEFFDWKSRAIVNRLGPSDDGASYDFRFAAAYTVAMSPVDSASVVEATNPWIVNGPWFSNWNLIMHESVPVADLNAGKPNMLFGAYFPGTTSYWGNLQPAISYSVMHKAPGAAAAFGRLTGATNWPDFVKNCKDGPVWCIKPRE
ncbi:hypothetical protein [Bdellovibrio bacteriovorus]|uniref:hypothetical protein n=1 Tax=Bdellovibrio bacteriovorus TaxID=959 RepID=UPI0005A1AB34|nr:hypothetical protein [Bdellovibrio bacteriovorus]